jgi:hypothetical protein
MHPLAHAALTGVTVDQHHIRPSNIEVANTTLVIDPLPGGPGVWDIAVPLDTIAVVFSFRGLMTTSDGGGKSGLNGVATRNSLEATCISFTAGVGVFIVGSYHAVYSKPAAVANLSHKMWGATGEHVVLRDAWLELTAPTTRVFRTQWINYAGSLQTLKCWGEVQCFG